MMTFPKCDLHTHTRYCDGANTPEEMIRTAIALGMETYGFSGHSFTSFDPSPCMSREGTQQYRAEIADLKARYGDQIQILCGIEQDFYSDDPAVGFDYVIGSVHYLPLDNGEYVCLDLSVEAIERLKRERFGGDIYKLIRAYYENMAQVLDKTHCDIVGHFDLIEKLNKNERLFCSSDIRYRKAALDALDYLLERDAIFEINSGGLPRGYGLVYPSSYLLRRIAEKRGRLVLNGDTHHKEHLMKGYPDAAAMAHACGVGGLCVPTPFGWETRPLGHAYKV